MLNFSFAILSKTVHKQISGQYPTKSCIQIARHAIIMTISLPTKNLLLPPHQIPSTSILDQKNGLLAIIVIIIILQFDLSYHEDDSLHVRTDSSWSHFNAHQSKFLLSRSNMSSVHQHSMSFVPVFLFICALAPATEGIRVFPLKFCGRIPCINCQLKVILRLFEKI